MRLRFLRPAETFGIICGKDQVNKMERVVQHNGGRAQILDVRGDAVYIAVVKL